MNISKPDNYLITSDTYFLKTHYVSDRNHTFIMDDFGVYDCPKSVTRIINSSCHFNGLSLQRLRAQARHFFKEKCHKLPLALAYENNLPVVFFSIYSPKSTSNIWINTNKVLSAEVDENKEVIVTFPNFNTLSVPVTYQAFAALYSRAVFFQRFLRNEIPTAANYRR